jgi:hypothetical protein
MMGRAVDDLLEKMTGDHIRVMDLKQRGLVHRLGNLTYETYKDTPEIHQHK